MYYIKVSVPYANLYYSELDYTLSVESVGTTLTGLTATPTASTVLVNRTAVAFDAYNIGGNNYFKLRDLAYVLSGTQA